MKEIRSWGAILFVIGVISYAAYVIFTPAVNINVLGLSEGVFEQVVHLEEVPYKAEVCVIVPGLLFDLENCDVEEDEDGVLEIGIPSGAVVKRITIRPFFVFFRELWARECILNGIVQLTCSPFKK